jgi:hypothetical protein
MVVSKQIFIDVFFFLVWCWQGGGHHQLVFSLTIVFH